MSTKPITELSSKLLAFIEHSPLLKSQLTLINIFPSETPHYYRKSREVFQEFLINFEGKELPFRSEIESLINEIDDELLALDRLTDHK